MGTLMQRLGGHVTQVPSGGFFLLTWETSKSSNMWWEKWENMGKAVDLGLRVGEICHLFVDTGCRYDIIMYGYVIVRTGSQAYIAPTFFYLWLTRSHLI